MTAEPSPERGVIVTLREIYDAVMSTERKVDKLDGKLDDVVTDSGDHETRIRAMEMQIWKWAGAAAALGISGGFGLSKLFGS